MVYFIRCGGRVKIGTSDNPRLRVAECQTGNPEPIELLGTIPGTRTLEAALHARFAHLRGLGEWFELAGDLRSYIRQALKDWPYDTFRADQEVLGIIGTVLI